MIRITLNRGVTLLEVLIGMAILTIVSSALYLAYSNTIDIVGAGQYHSAAANIIESEIEIVRNMNYEDIGTVGGIPAGKLIAQKTVILDKTEFGVNTFVRNIDDPFDGVLGGTPGDTAPADYKLVEIQIECDTCPRFSLIRSTTTVAPRNLESADGSGNLFIQVLDADGIALAGATVSVANNSVSPAVSLTDVTGINGQLQLVGVPTSSAGYEVTVSKTGYSGEQTYLPGDPGNPNPVKPHMTVAREQLTISTFSIDLTANMTVRAIDQLCSPVPDIDLLLTGSKLIGTSPDVPKYSAGHTTNSSGEIIVPGLEWDSYSVVSTDTGYEVAGTNASSPIVLDPEESVSVDWLVVPKSTSALLVSILDGQGQPVNDAAVRLQGTGYDTTFMSGHYRWTETDWNGNRYSNQSGDIDTTVSGLLTLAPSGGPYASGSYAWMESETIDFGSVGTNFTSLTFNPASQPPAAGAASVRLQMAANNDNSTWNYVGSDGTPNSFFTPTDTMVPGLLSANRYVRYRIEMKTDDTLTTPGVEDVTIEYSAGCLPSGAAHFNGLGLGTYTLTISKSGFQDFTDDAVDINTDWREYKATLAP